MTDYKVTPINAYSSATVVGSNNAINMFDGNTSTYWSLPATTAYPIYARLQLDKQYRVASVMIDPFTDSGGVGIKDFDILGTNTDSTDLSTYTLLYSGTKSNDGNPQTFSFINNTKYQYYALRVKSSYRILTGSTSANVVIEEMELYASQVNKILILSSNGEVESITQRISSTTNSIPVMTSNTAPSGTASASTVNDATNYPAWKAFNGINSAITDCWVSANSSLTGWLKYQFPLSKLISKYRVISRNDVNRGDLKSWTFEGSNDGTNWTVLDTKTNQTGWSQNETRDYDIDNSQSYLYYRINITALTLVGSGNYITLGELMMFDFVGIRAISIPDSSESNFINYGINDITKVNPKKALNGKQYIQSINTTLGSGKTFSQPLDLNKYKVNKISFQ